jgi:hypothetical protein
MNNNAEPNTGVFPFIQDTFTPGKKDKEYILKISSNDTLLKYPFDFQVKFAMDIIDSSNNLKKEAIIYNKYIDITFIEVSDVIIPRFIPTSTIGKNIDGFRLIKTANNKFMISCYPGCSIKTGLITINTISYNFIKLISPKESLFIIKRGIAHNYSVLINDSVLKDELVIDHLNYNNDILPILDISNNEIIVNNYNITLPNTIPIIIADSNILFKTSTASANATTLTIPDMPLALIENIYADNTIRILDAFQNNYYFKISSYSNVSNNIIFKGNWSDLSYGFEGISNLYLFSFGSKDLLDERIFFIELESFKPSKCTSTNNQFDKMFGVLFPSTQSKNWLYLSGEPKQVFLPTDFRKMDKLTIKLYDSNGNNLNDIFYKKLGLLNTDYNSTLYSSLIIKIQENSKSLHITN